MPTTTTAWINNDALVIDSSGRVILCSECPCVTPGTGTGTGYGTPMFSSPPLSNVPVTVCCPGIFPHTLTATLYDETTSCPALDGMVVVLSYDDTTGTWRGGASRGACAAQIELSCDSNPLSAHYRQWRLGVYAAGGVSFQNSYPSTAVCNPFYLEFDGIPVTGASGFCCDALITVTVTL